jgi:transposase-like protein
MPRKPRVSPEEKASIVEKYINGEAGKNAILFQHKIGWTTLRDWVRLYKTRGAEGLTPAARNRKYAPETKRAAVLEYLSGTASQNDICVTYNISRRSMLQNWIKRYNSHGDFKEPNTGGAIYMDKGRKTTAGERVEIVSFCIAKDKDYGATIEKYGVSYQQIYTWVRKYEQNGAEGLIDRRGKRKDAPCGGRFPEKFPQEFFGKGAVTERVRLSGAFQPESE